MKKLPYLHTVTNRKGGTKHYYVRRKGFPLMPVKGKPGSPEFLESYRAAFTGTDSNVPASADAAIRGSAHRGDRNRTAAPTPRPSNAIESAADVACELPMYANSRVDVSSRTSTTKVTTAIVTAGILVRAGSVATRATAGSRAGQTWQARPGSRRARSRTGGHLAEARARRVPRPPSGPPDGGSLRD